MIAHYTAACQWLANTTTNCCASDAALPCPPVTLQRFPLDQPPAAIRGGDGVHTALVLQEDVATGVGAGAEAGVGVQQGVDTGSTATIMQQPL